MTAAPRPRKVRRPAPSPARRWLLWGFIVVSVLLGLAGVAVLAVPPWIAALDDRLLTNEALVVEVPPGAAAQGVVDALVASQAIPGDLRWPFWVRQRGLAACLRAGTHRIAPPVTGRALADALCEMPRREGVRVTLREGLARWEVADVLDESGVCAREPFLEAVARTTVTLHGVTTPDAEGWLSPDTWEFFPDTDPQRVVDRLVQHAIQRFERVVAAHPGALERLAESHGLDAHEVMVLASLVEAEAAVADERPMIARAFLNRLQVGMRMQSDPTCTYAADRVGQPATPAWCRDRELAWNTYTHDGLPPTPINSPGEAAIAAVLAPADDPDVLYFVAVGDDSRRHRFAATLEEHGRNVDAYRRARQAQAPE